MTLNNQSFERPNYFFDLYENCVEKEIPFHICLECVAIATKPLTGNFLFLIIILRNGIKKVINAQSVG